MQGAVSRVFDKM